jgi:hypothetical protein
MLSTPAKRKEIRAFPATPEAGRTILTGSGSVKNWAFAHKLLKTNAQLLIGA